jgi:hypothetical protein
LDNSRLQIQIEYRKGKINYLGAVISKAELYHDEEKLNGA